MLACVACSMLLRTNWLAHVQSLRALDCERTAIKTIRNWSTRKTQLLCFKIPIHDFHKQDNSFHINSTSTCCNHRYRCYNDRRHTTMQTKVFALVRNSYRASQLAIETHSFLSNFIFKLQTKASTLYQASFKFSNNCKVFDFFEAYVTCTDDFMHN